MAVSRLCSFMHLTQLTYVCPRCRIKTIEILMAIHKRGLQHNDFCPQNVVVDDVKSPSCIKLIDFQHCSPHKCERQMQLRAYDFPPLYPDFGCRELWFAAKTSRLWTPCK